MIDLAARRGDVARGREAADPVVDRRRGGRVVSASAVVRRRARNGSANSAAAQPSSRPISAADERRVPRAPRRGLGRDRRLDDPRLLDLGRERAELARVQEILLDRAPPLLERRQRRVQARDDEQPLRDRQRLVRQRPACSRAAMLKRELMPSSSFSSLAICSSSVASLSST